MQTNNILKKIKDIKKRNIKLNNKHSVYYLDKTNMAKRTASSAAGYILGRGLMKGYKMYSNTK